MAHAGSQTELFRSAGWTCLKAHGPWPFVTRRVFQNTDSPQHIWTSRAHRKRLIHPIERVRWAHLLRWVWAPNELNWWIGTVFAVGASLFAIGCVLSLSSHLAGLLGLSAMEVNGVFFAGSIPFTTAAYLQLFQAANAPEPAPPGVRTPPRLRVWFGWRPDNARWLSCFLQFIGTILFNVNTFDAMIPGLTWGEQELAIWMPNLVGSVLFLMSGYLAFIETCHTHWAWKLKELSWWVVFTNLLGCIGFMVAAVFSFVPGGAPRESWILASTVFTLQGALCFLMGSLLMLPEGVTVTRRDSAQS